MDQRLMDGGKEDDATRHHGEHRCDKVQDRMEFILRSFFLQLPPSEEEDQSNPYPRTHRWDEPAHLGKSSDDRNGHQQAGAYPGEGCRQNPARTGFMFHMVHKYLSVIQTWCLWAMAPPS